MPVVHVPRYGGRKVLPDALPAVRKSAAETAESAGAGLAEAQGRTAGALGDLAATGTHVATRQIALQARMAEEERERADQVAVQEYRNALGLWQNKRTLDPTDGAFTLQGKAALGIPEQLAGEFNEVSSALEANLSPRQRALAQPIKAQQSLNLDLSARRHVYGEMQRYDAETLQATEINAAETATVNALDDRIVNDELQRGIDAITAAGPRLGLTGPVLEQRLNAFTTKTYVGVINRLVAHGEVDLARDYFEKGTKAKQITGTAALAQLEATLHTGTSIVKAQKVAERVIAEGGTITEQRAQVTKELDGEDQDRALQYVEHDNNLKKQAKRDTEETLLDTVYTRLLRNGGDLRSITPAEQVALGSHLGAVQSFAEHQSAEKPRKNDPEIYYTMMDQAVKEPANFAGLVLQPLQNKLDAAHYDKLVAVQHELRLGKAPKVLDDYRSESAVVANTLKLADLDPSPPSDSDAAKRVAQFQDLVADEVRRTQEITGKKVSNEELKAISNRLLAIQITDKGWFSDSTRSLATATPADVPAAEMTLILDSLRSHGRPATPEAALAIWLRSQARKGSP